MLLHTAVHKRRLQSGGLSSADKGEEGSSDADVRTLVQKSSDFSEIYVSARTRGLSQCEHFSDKGGGGQFCADVLYERPIL